MKQWRNEPNARTRRLGQLTLVLGLGGLALIPVGLLTGVGALIIVGVTLAAASWAIEVFVGTD